VDRHHPRLQVAPPARGDQGRRTATRVSRRPSSGVGASSSTAKASGSASWAPRAISAPG
jgi:hypothetical protein